MGQVFDLGVNCFFEFVLVIFYYIRRQQLKIAAGCVKLGIIRKWKKNYGKVGACC